ncbi:MAG: flagellar hook-basal body complex protein [Christensenellales bacterium]|jgi:flagellar hook protein FlgE
MMRSLYSGITGLKNHQTRMDVIGNNIANVNTVGYKTARVVFQDIYSQTLSSAAGPQGNNGGVNPKQIGLGVSLSSIDVIHTSAASQYTGSPLDIAIEGDGYFIIRVDNQDFYTRAGNFNIGPTGALLNAGGNYVQCYGSIYQEGSAGKSTDKGFSNRSTNILANLSFDGSQPSITQTPSGVYTFKVDNLGNFIIQKGGNDMVPQPSYTLTDNMGNPITPSGAQMLRGSYKLSIPTLGEFSFDVVGSAIPYRTPDASPVVSNQSYAYAIDVSDGATGAFEVTLDGTELGNTKFTIRDAGGDIVTPGSPMADGDYTVTINDTGVSFDVTLAGGTGAGSAAGNYSYLFQVDSKGTVSILHALSKNALSPQPTFTLYDSSLMAVRQGESAIRPGQYTINTSGQLGLDDEIVFQMDGETFTFSTLNDVFLQLQNVLNTASVTVSNNDQFVADMQIGNMVIDEDLYTQVTIDPSGAIMATMKYDGYIPGTDLFASAGETVTLGFVALATFINPGGLEKVGSNMYRQSTNSGRATVSQANQDGSGKLNPGALEMSGVDLANEFTDLIVTQRGFQANSRTITTTDSMLEELVNLKR